MNRFVTLTQKVESRFGSLYCHVDLDADGRVIGVSFSTPGKIDGKEIDDLIQSLGAAVTSLIQGESHVDGEAAQGAGAGATG